MLKQLVFTLILKPLALILIGLSVENRKNLPLSGPAIIAANHNSHLDTLVLLSLFRFKTLPKVRPLAAADYFLKTPLMRFIGLKIMGIIPIKREKIGRETKDPFSEAYAALDRGEIIILYPEGTRGEPEEMEAFKNGIARLASHDPDIPVTPVFLHGLGKALPRGEALFVPFFCTVLVGRAIHFKGSKKDFMDNLLTAFKNLVAGRNFQS